MSNAYASLNTHLMSETQLKTLKIRKLNANPKYLPTFEQPQIHFYLIGIFFIEVLLILISVLVRSNMHYETQLKYAAQILLGVFGSIGVTWAIYGMKNQYISKFWGIFWFEYSLAAILSIFMLVYSYSGEAFIFLYTILITLGAEAFFQHSFKRFWIVLPIDFPIIGIFASLFHPQYQNAPIRIHFVIFIILAVPTFGFLIFFIVQKYRKWNTWKQYEKIQHLFYYYLIILVMTFSIIGCTAYFGNYPWPILFAFNHIFFVLLCVYIEKKTRKNMRITEKIKRIFACFKRKNNQLIEQTQIQILYQISNNQLSDLEIHKNIQLMPKSLDRCKNCGEQQSIFCYQQCKHALIGMNCVLNWITNDNKKCQICQTISHNLIRIQRSNSNLFKVIGRYKKQIKINEIPKYIPPVYLKTEQQLQYQRQKKAELQKMYQKYEINQMQQRMYENHQKYNKRREDQQNNRYQQQRRNKQRRYEEERRRYRQQQQRKRRNNENLRRQAENRRQQQARRQNNRRAQQNRRMLRQNAERFRRQEQNRRRRY